MVLQVDLENVFSKKYFEILSFIKDKMITFAKNFFYNR